MQVRIAELGLLLGAELVGDPDLTVSRIAPLETAGAECEVKIYEGQGHSFTGEAWPDSQRLAVEFLDRRLKKKAK